MQLHADPDGGFSYGPPKPSPAADDAIFVLDGAFRFTPRGVVIVGSPSLDSWLGAVRWTQTVINCDRLWLGDLLRFGEVTYGERYAQAMDVTGLAYQTLANAAWVAGSVDVSRRRETLSFGHHAEVAALPAAEQVAWLDKAEADRLSVSELRAAVRSATVPPASYEADSAPICWLTVSCADDADRDALRARMLSEGREVK